MVKFMKKLKLSRKKPSCLEQQLKQAKTHADIERIVKKYANCNGTYNI